MMTDNELVLKALYDTCYFDNFEEIKSKIDSIDFANIDSISTLSSNAIDDIIMALNDFGGTYATDSKPLGIDALSDILCSYRADTFFKEVEIPF